jgi:hypothetical protein
VTSFSASLEPNRLVTCSIRNFTLIARVRPEYVPFWPLDAIENDICVQDYLMSLWRK